MMPPSSFSMPESGKKLNCVLLKLAISVESRDELRWFFLRRKNERRAEVLPRRAVPVSQSTTSPERSSSSTLSREKENS